MSPNVTYDEWEAVTGITANVRVYKHRDLVQRYLVEVKESPTGALLIEVTGAEAKRIARILLQDSDLEEED